MNRTKIHEPWAKPWTINQGLTLSTPRSSFKLLTKQSRKLVQESRWAQSQIIVNMVLMSIEVYCTLSDLRPALVQRLLKYVYVRIYKSRINQLFELDGVIYLLMNLIITSLCLNFDMFKGRQGQGSSGGLHPLPAVEVSPALPVSAVSITAAAQEKISPHFTQSCWRQTGVTLTCPASWGRGGTGEAGATQPKGGVCHLIFQYVEIFIWLIPDVLPLHGIDLR